MTITVNADAIIASTSTNDHPTIYLDIQGPPMAQARPRFQWHVAANRGVPVVYDPSRAMKRACRTACARALMEVGITNFPFFPDGHLHLKVLFFVHNQAKDLDNLTKFVMDALETVVYTNDRDIWEAHIKKVAVGKPDEFTRIEIQELI
jgi:Holliday junction resolvase RusA-like endonuclease